MEEKKKSGFATVGLVLGIIGVSTSFIPIVNNASFVLGILAVIFGIIAFIQKSTKGKVIAAIILGILAIVITIESQESLSNSINEAFDELDQSFNEMSGEKTEDILANYLDVSIGNFEVVEDEYFDETKLVVKLKNKSSEKKSFDIQIEAVSNDGSRIDQEYIYANELGAGQSQEFEIFTYVSSDKLDIMKNANFKIVEVSMY